MNKNTVYEVWCFNEKANTFHNATDDPAHGGRATSVGNFHRACALASTSAGYSWYGKDFNGDHFMVVSRTPHGVQQCATPIESPAVLLKEAVKAANEGKVLMYDDYYKGQYLLLTPTAQDDDDRDPMSYDTLKYCVRTDPTFGFYDAESDTTETIEETSSHSDAELWTDVIWPAIETGKIVRTDIDPAITDRCYLGSSDIFNSTELATLYGCLVQRAALVVNHYISDLYHDVHWLDKHVHGETTFFYSVRPFGTHIGEEAKDVFYIREDGEKHYEVRITKGRFTWYADFIERNPDDPDACSNCGGNRYTAPPCVNHDRKAT